MTKNESSIEAIAYIWEGDEFCPSCAEGDDLPNRVPTSNPDSSICGRCGTAFKTDAND